MEQEAATAGQRLLEDLVRAIAANTAVYNRLTDEISALRTDLRDAMEVQGEMCGVLQTGVVLLDRLAAIAKDESRSPGWPDVAKIIEDIREEAEESEDDS